MRDIKIEVVCRFLLGCVIGEIELQYIQGEGMGRVTFRGKVRDRKYIQGCDI